VPRAECARHAPSASASTQQNLPQSAAPSFANLPAAGAPEELMLDPRGVPWSDSRRNYINFNQSDVIPFNNFFTKGVVKDVL
jgi:hypothetical protein